MKYIRLFGSLTALLLLLTATCFLASCRMPTDEGFTVGQLRVEPLSLKAIEVEWMTGNCQILVHDSEELYVYEETTETNADNRMRWKLEDGKLTVRFRKPRLFDKAVSYEKTLYLYLPRHLLNGIQSVNVTSISSHLTAKDLKAETLRLNTVSGDLTAVGLSCDEGEVVSVSGDVMVTGCRADVLTVGNTSGNVQLNASNAIAALSVSTVSGDQDVSVSLGADDLILASVSGEITALLPDELAVTLTCASDSGLVKVEENLRLTLSGDTYTRGDGGLTGSITTASGNVTLKRLLLISPDEP